jgi:hypothetical protein
MASPQLLTSLSTWFPDGVALARFRRGLGRVPLVVAPRDPAWRSLAPGFPASVALATEGLPFQIAADRRYDRVPDRRRLARALAEGATVYFPQIHQVLPRVMRLMVALRAAFLGPRREQCSFLFAVEGTGRPGMGLHHDGRVDAFWVQLEGRRTVTIGPPVPPGTPEDLDDRLAGDGRGWRTLDLRPGTLFYLPPWTPHAVVCAGRSLALSLTWTASRRRASVGAGPTHAEALRLARWDVVSGQVAEMPPLSARRLWTQIPAVARPHSGGLSLVTADGDLDLPRSAGTLARHLALMPSFERADARAAGPAVDLLIAHGILGPQDLPLRIVPADPGTLDGWRFA